VVDRLRELCLTLDGAVEIEAWTGTSWRVGDVTFAHVVQLDDGWPPRYARAFRTGGAATVVTFQSDEADALTANGHPFYRPGWRRDLVGLVIDDDSDWGELRELLIDSHLVCSVRHRRRATR
jgi:hypothetical protein